MLARRCFCHVGCKSFSYVPYVEYVPNIVQGLKCLVVVAEQSESTLDSIKFRPLAVTLFKRHTQFSNFRHSFDAQDSYNTT